MNETPEQREDRERRERCARLGEVVLHSLPIDAPLTHLGATIPPESSTIAALLRPINEARFSEDQPRDSDGKFASGGGDALMALHDEIKDSDDRTGANTITDQQKMRLVNKQDIKMRELAGAIKEHAKALPAKFSRQAKDVVSQCNHSVKQLDTIRAEATAAYAAGGRESDIGLSHAIGNQEGPLQNLHAQALRVGAMERGLGDRPRRDGLPEQEERYSEDQPRDEKGKFTTGSGGEWKGAKERVGADREKEYKKLAESHDAIFYDDHRTGWGEGRPEDYQKDLAQWQQSKLTNLHSQIEDARTRLGMKEKNDTMEVAGRVLSNARVDMNAKQWPDATTGQDRALYLMHTVILSLGGHKRCSEELWAERRYSDGEKHEFYHPKESYGMGPGIGRAARWLRQPDVRYSEDQPRDDHGRFGEGGGERTEAQGILAAHATGVSVDKLSVEDNKAQAAKLVEAYKTDPVLKGAVDVVSQYRAQQDVGLATREIVAQTLAGKTIEQVSQNPKVLEQMDRYNRGVIPEARLGAAFIQKVAEGTPGYFRALQQAETTKDTVYRGAAGKGTTKSEFELRGPTAFSHDLNVAMTYAGRGGTLYKVEPGAKMLPTGLLEAVQHGASRGEPVTLPAFYQRAEDKPSGKPGVGFSMGLDSDRELTSSGRFQVVGRQRDYVSYKDVLSGERKTRSMTIITVKQTGVF